MTTRPRSSDDPLVGLCATCVHMRRVANRRGSVFYRCALSAHDPRFPRYPRLPVLRCLGYEPDAAAAADGLDAAPAPEQE